MSEMRIKNYEAWVSLGCTQEEQTMVQPVLFNVEILFNSKVLAEETDQLQDSLDYVELTNVIKMVAEKKSYKMIEHMCSSVARALQQSIGQKYKGTLIVRMQKPRAPVKHLHGGVEWSCQLSL